MRKPLAFMGGRGCFVVLVAAWLAVAAPDVYPGEVARGELAIVGLGLEVQREPVVTAVDVPSFVQTKYAAPATGLSALGDLTGPGIDAPITLSAVPGQKFAIPALHEKGEYLLQNIRLAGAAGEFLQAAVPNVATIQVTDVLKTNVKVRQLTPEELRERGILIDDRNFEVYEYTFIFGVDEQQVEIPYPVIIDKRTRQIVPALPAAFRMLPYPKLQKPPRFTPPYIEPFDLSSGGPPTNGTEADRQPRFGGVSLPAALVVPNGFGVMHQFFAVILQVSNSAPEGSNIRLDSISASIKSPLSMRIAKQVPAVAIGQPVPVVDERTGATFLVAGAQGSAEWALEALKAGTHTVDIDVRATYQKPGQDDFALGGRVSTSIVVSDPRFHVNFSHPDVVRKDDRYTAYAFVTNLSNQRQHVELDLSDIPSCTSGSSANNVCRYEGSDKVTLDLDAGEMVPVPHKLISRVTGKVYAGAGAASDAAVSVSIRLTMGVSESGIPLSPATLVMPHHAQFLPSEFVDAHMQLLGLGYSLATAPLTKYTALKPRVITTDVFRRAQQIALAGQRVFSTAVPEEHRNAFIHLSLDLLGNIERVDRHDVMPELAEWDELRRTEEAGRIAARAMARQLETIVPFVDDYAAATSHRTPFLLAYAHGPPVAGNTRPYALSVRGLTTQTLLDVPAEANSGWVRGLAYGELTKLGQTGELALVGRWSETMRVSVVPAAPSFTLHLLYPDHVSGKMLRTDVEITNARAGVPVTIDVARGNRTLIVNGATATPLVNEVGEPPLRVLGAAQDMHLDGGGHVVSLLFNRPVEDDGTLRDRLALTINVPKANYSVTRRNSGTGELQIPAARLQEDGRLLLITFDKTLSRNALYEIAIDRIASGIVPRIHNDRPAAILTGRVLNGDNTPVPHLLVRLLMHNARVKGIDGFSELVQYDVGGDDGRFLFEFVPRDIDNGLLGEYNLIAETADGRQAALNGSVRLPGEVHHANLVFLGRGKARGQVRWEDGTPIGDVHVGAGSSLFGGMYGTTADANGFYELDGLPVGPLVFSTVAPDGRLVYATNAIRTAGEVITQDLVAVRKEGPPPGVATVRVRVLRSDTMQPVSGASAGVGSVHVPLMTQTTDSQGRAEFRGVPAGLMSIIAADYSISRHGAAVEVELRGDQLLDQDLVLQVADTSTRYAWLEGVVTRDDPSAPSDTTKDQVVANAVITIQQLPPITANADGTFLYPDIPTSFSDRWIQVFDPATSRSGWFKVPTLSEGANRMPLRLSSANPHGHGTFRVRLSGGRGEPVAGARVFAPGYPPSNYSNKGGGVYEMGGVRVPQRDVVMAVMNDPDGPYGEQYVQGDTRVDFDGQVGITDLRLPGNGTLVVNLEMERGAASGPVALTYTAWDDHMQMAMPKTIVREPDPSTNLVTFTRVPARQDVLLATVRHPSGYAEEKVRLLFDGDARSVTLRLETIGNVSGRVFAHDGITPVAGATVRITTNTAVYAPALTKQDGSFLFAAMPANTNFDVVAELRQDGIFRTAIVSGKTPEGGGPVSDLIAVMREQASVEGRVVDALDGTPVPLARYWLRELAWPYRSIGTAQDPLHADINGRFVVSNVFTGPYRVTAVAPDNQERRGDHQGTLLEEGDVSQRDIRVRIGGAGAGTVSITVVDPVLGFEPVPNAEVALLRDGSGFDFTTTNDAGVAYFEQVPVGPSYSAFVYSKQRGRSGRSAAFNVSANAITSRSIQLEFLGIVSGTLTDPDTSPPSLPVRGQPVTYMGPITLRATSDAGGNFEFNGVPEGNFELQAWELSTQRIANGPPGLFISKLVPEQRNIRLEMERMGTLTVRVHLPNDTGGPGELAPLVEVTAVQCTICNLIVHDYPYYRSAQGNPIVFPRMFRRVGYGLEVRELGGESRTIASGGSFPAGAFTHEQIIVLPQSGSVEALVLDGNGKPVADAEVAFSGGKQAVVFTGADGRASLTGLPFGWYTLQAKKGNVTAAASGELKSRSQPLRLTLNLGTNVTVTGFVEAEEGVRVPSPRTRVLMDVSSRLLSGGLRLETLTDEQGRFTFTGIPVGGTTLSLLYYGPDDTTVGRRLPWSIADGTTGTVTLPDVKLDATPPRILAIDPPANATNVSPSSPVTITFSEPLKGEYLTRFHFELADTDTPQEIVASNVFGSIRPDKTYVVTVMPPDPPAGRTHRLKSNMLYRFAIAAGIEDLTGNRLRNAIGTSFTTVNYTEPEVVRIDPPETEALGDQVTFRIKFNKAVDVNSGSITLDLLDEHHGNAVRRIDVARNPDVADPTTILVAPAGYAIEESKFYRVTVAGVRDTQSPANTQKIVRVFDFFSFDRVKPLLSIVSPVASGEKLIAGVLYAATVASSDKDLAYVDWLDAGGTSVARVKTKPYTYSFVAPSNASSFTLQATGTDLSNNTSETPASMTWEVAPNLPPAELAIANDVTSVYPSGRVASRVKFKDEGVSVTVALELRGTALDGSPVTQLLGSQKITRASTAVEFAEALFNWNVPLSLKDGSATVVATVTDSVNNAASADAALTILLDQTKPVLVSFLPKAESRYKFGVNGLYTVELQVRDAETGVARAVVTVGGVEVFNGAGTLEAGVTTFRKDVSVPPKNADTRVPVTVTAYDHRGNAVTATHEVIYERVDDSTLPRAAWITPLDGAVLPSNQSGWLTTLRVRASDDVKVTRVRFESSALAAPIDLTAPLHGDVFETKAALTFGEAPFVVKAIVSDGDPSHDVELPITIEPVVANPVIVGDINITSTNAAQYAGKPVLVRGNVKVYISTPIALQDLMLVDGAVLSVPEETRLDVTVERLFVDGDSRVDVTAKGWLGGLRTREDNSFTNPSSSGRTAFAPGATATADGSHGGIGGSSLGLTNPTYGSLTAPADFGAGGGAISSSERGGNGGGAVVLRGTRLVLAGIVRADGEVHSSAGAGGSILLDTRALITGPATRITANGGDAGASLDHDRGGGGGRIAVIATERFDRDASIPLLQARGGRNGNGEGAGYVDGGAGTVVVNNTLTVSSFDERHPSTTHRTAGTPLGGWSGGLQPAGNSGGLKPAAPQSALAFDSITIGPRALARFDAGVPANVTTHATATVIGPDDLPAVTLLSTNPAVNADVPQHTNIVASFTATSPTGVRQVQAGDGSAYPRFATSVSGTPLTIPIAATATPGPFSTKLRVLDRAGRVAESETMTFNIVANTPPVIESFVAADESYAGRTVNVTASARDDVAVKSLTLASSVGTVNGLAVTLPPAVPSGTNVVLTLSASDGFPGRAPTTQTRTLIIKKDTLPPVVGIAQPVANQQFEEGTGATFLVEVTASDAEVAVQRVTATLDGVTHELQLAGNRWQKTLSVPSVDGTEPVAKTLAVRAYDYEGNGADASVAFTVKPLIDPEAPALAWNCASPNAMFPAGYEVTLRVDAVPSRPANGVTSVEFAIANGAPVAASRVGTSNTFEAKYTIPAATTDGTQLDVRVVARSAGGNEATLLGTISVVSGVTINAASTITANDTAFEDQTIVVVQGGVLTVVGPHRLRNLVVLNGGRVEQRSVDPLRADELRVERLYVACGGAVDVTGLGLVQRSAYPGAGTPDSGSGGSHIGRGATWTRSTGGAYGSVLEPKEPGGGGNTAFTNEGSGGGMVRIRATGAVIVDGAVRANGYGSALGGGAGGSVWIITPVLGGAGAIEARGTINGYGAGAGGAIALEYASSSGTYRVDASGGTTNHDSARTSAPGTIVRNRALLVDAKGIAISNTAVTELPSFGHATVAAVDGSSVTLAEKRWVSPSLTGHRLRAFAPDGSVRGTYRLASVARHPSMVTLDGWTLVQTQDAADYDGYLMYTPAGLGGKRYVAVRRLGADWQYDNDSAFVTFVPTPGDVLFATFSKSGNRFRALEPLPCCAAIGGIAVAEIVAGEIAPDANTPNPNEGLTIFDAGELFLRPDARHRAFTLSAGAATLTLEKLSGAGVQAGDRLRGVYQFDSIEVKNARVVTEDLVEGTGSTSVIGGNLSAPALDPSKMTVVLGRDGPLLIGAAGAIADVDGPLEVAARNGNHALPPPTTMRGDDYVGYGTAGGFSVVHQQNARNGLGSTTALKSISEGYLSFSPSQADQPMQAGLSSYEFRLLGNGTYEVWAGGTSTAKSGAYAANTPFRIEKSATAMRWFVDNVQVHEVTSGVPASVTFEVSMTQALRGELGSIEYASGLPARSLHAKVAADGSFRVPLSGAPGDPIRVRARDRHTYSLESDEVTVASYPSNAGVATLTFAPSEVTGGRSSSGAVTLHAPAGSEGALVVLRSDGAFVTVPASIILAPGATSGTFTASTSAVQTPLDVNVTATYGGNGVTTALRVLKDNIPPGVTITAPAANAEYLEGQASGITVRATAVDEDSGVKRASVVFDGRTYPMTLSAGVWTATVPVPFVDGTANVSKDIVVLAEDHSGNSATSAPVTVIVKPVVDNAPPSVAWTCASGGALFPAGYAAPLRVTALAPSANNQLQKVEITVGETTLVATAKGNDVYEALFTIPDVADGTLFTLSATATTASGTTASASSSFRAIKGAVELRTNTAIAASDTSLDNKSVVVWEGATVTIDGAHAFDRLVVLGTVTHPLRRQVDVTASALYVSCTGTFDATSLGHHLDDRYPGTHGADYADGGSHLGRGGDVNEGRTFGSIHAPLEGGGGGYPGNTRGGGVIRLRATTLTVDGAVRALGGNVTGSDNGAGAGGSVWITAAKIDGAGSISANGGDGCEAGGGGAVNIEYSDASSKLPSLAARAGLAQCGGRIGGPGTVRVSGPASPLGDVTIDSMGSGAGITELPSLGSGLAQSGSGGATLVTGRASDIQPFFKGHWVRVTASDGSVRGTWRIDTINARTVTLANASGITAGDRWQGLYRFDSLTLRGGVTLLSGDPVETATQTISAPLTTSSIHAASLHLAAGAVVTHPVGGSLTIDVANELRIDAGAVIDATALGYHVDQRYPGVSNIDYADGGSHVGRGGDVFNNGQTFGSIYTPAEGGGGGYPGNSRGGGVIRIRAGSLVVNGTIRAPGQNVTGGDSGGGAGGSVWITATRVSGTGSISANGGDGCEAGGGGAIAVEYSDATSTLPALAARAGVAQCGSRIGGPGTIRVAGPASTHGDVLVDSMGSGIGTTELPSLGSGTAQTGSNGATLVTGRASDIQPFFKGHWVRITAADGSVRGTWRIASINARTVTLDGASGIIAGDRWQGLYRFDDLTLRGGVVLLSADPIETATQTISAPVTTSAIDTGTLRLTSGAVLTHPLRGSLQVRVANELRVDAGAVIDATSLGHHVDDRYPGVSNIDYADGGSHLGRGGDVFNTGQTFGSVSTPQEGGGGGYPGNTRGGGIVRVIAGSLVVNGEIRAPGGNVAGGDSGGGAGGSVWITAARISGTGTISANGGDGCEAGGGGAIAVEYSDAASTLPALAARPGTAQCSGRIGGPGTVRVAGPSSQFGDVTIDSAGFGAGTTELPSLGSGSAQTGSNGATLVTGRTSDIQPFFKGHWVRITAPDGSVRGTWRIATINARTVTLDGASGITPGDAWQGVYRFDALTLAGGVTLLSNDPIETATQTISAPVTTSRIRANALRLAAGAVLTHPLGGSLTIDVAGELRIDSGAVIDATALGYDINARYPGVAGIDYADGGSHIGQGGDVFNLGQTYGSIERPSEAGGGGYPGGARGGGVVRIRAASVIVNGIIRAPGANVSGGDTGGGAGGSVWITATKISGSGTISANGGDGCQAGGGGAISVEYSDATSTPPATLARAGSAGCANRIGGAGSVRLFGPASTHGDVTFDTGSLGHGRTELPSFGSGVAQSGSGGAVLVTDRAASSIQPFYLGHWVRVTAANGSVRGLWRIRSVDAAKTVTLDGASGIEPGDRWEGVYRFDTLTLRGVQVISSDRIESRRQDVIDFTRMNRVATGTLRVHPSSTLTHWDMETLDVAASVEVRVDAGGAIDASALGYNSDSRYPGTPGIDYADGGSHIGRGGDVVPGRTYGSVYRPAERGGGGYPGGSKGGGVIRIATPLLTVDGAIRANGSHVTGGDNGGGAGGSIRITTTKIAGSGAIAADGGNGCEAGGGGALSIEYSDATSVPPPLTARAGVAECGGRVGGAGSIYTFGPSATYGELLADNTGRGAGTTELPSLGKGTAQAGTSGAALVVDRDVAPYFVGHWVEVATKGTWRIAAINGRTITLEGASALAAGDAWEGVYRFDKLTKRETTVVSNDRIDVITTPPSGAVDAPVASLTFLTLDPTRVPGGASVQAVVTLSGEAPLGGALVLLTSNGPVVMPEAVLIPHGATTAVFTVQTTPVAEPVEVTITATWGVSRNATLRIER